MICIYMEYVLIYKSILYNAPVQEETLMKRYAPNVPAAGRGVSSVQ